MILPFTFSGIVKKNTGRGKKHGFPTANIDPPEKVADGIYFGYTSFEDKKLPSLIFVGAAITFDDTQRFAESYILDFHGDLYDKTLEFELLEYIREGRKFVSAEEMNMQISEDERLARIYFSLPEKLP